MCSNFIGLDYLLFFYFRFFCHKFCNHFIITEVQAHCYFNFNILQPINEAGGKGKD